MAARQQNQQSAHDAAVRAAGRIYENRGKTVWVNPGSELNKSWSGHFIDVIVTNSPGAERAWVVEIETDDSVSRDEATSQWRSYDSVYQFWHLAVPVNAKPRAEQLLRECGINNCKVITWTINSAGLHTFWDLPGV